MDLNVTQDKFYCVSYILLFIKYRIFDIITGRFNGKAGTPIADLACIPASRSYKVKIKSEKPSATVAVIVNPSIVFIITLTGSHAATLSNLPISH
jgi:hypothetical protein